MVMATSLLLGACDGKDMNVDTKVKAKGNTENVIGRSDIKVEDGRMTPEVLWAMGRIGGMNVSPDGQKVVYTVAYYSVPENRSNREVFVMNADGTGNKQITKTAYSENEAVWIKGGKKIAFLCNESGSSQLWEEEGNFGAVKRLSKLWWNRLGQKGKQAVSAYVPGWEQTETTGTVLADVSMCCSLILHAT